MKERDLITALMNASELEESHTQRVATMFLDDFDWDGVEEWKVRKVKDILKVIRSQTAEHERILDGLIGKARESGKDEF